MIPELGGAIARPRQWPPMFHTGRHASPREVRLALSGTRLAVLGLMDIAQLALVVGPLLWAAAGHLLGGIMGVTAGFVIPLRPLVVAWLFRDR